ncbi:hypothetical protein HYW46_02190 [Candidatus Daviesbacteria bacterium]|nr:hypothetical protein [Candidatus Daviesbacteria bacterium]
MNKSLILILFVVDYIWLKSSFGKLTEGKFVGSLAPTLTKFASNNPYPPVKDFLQNIAIPNSQTFAYLTMWGETFVTVALLVSALFLFFSTKVNKLMLLLLVPALFVGMLLNLVFWLSSGWVSSAADGLNMLMFVVEVVGLFLAVRILVKKPK